jgi:type I restriction-modification system DNA methylase subunit
MDCLNDPQHKKELGAFYTPKEYCKLAVNFVREAISKVPKGNDYVIIDRCAGTGNLEVCLSDEELSHTIVSTYELKE